MNYNELVEELIDTNKQYRKMFGDNNKQFLSPVFYAVDFCTVAVDIGRGVGKTTFIKNHANKNDLVIVSNPIAKKFSYGMNTEYKVITLDELDKSRGRRYETIYIDEPTAVFKGEPNSKFQMYQVLADPMMEQTFVLLGK